MRARRAASRPRAREAFEADLAVEEGAGRTRRPSRPRRPARTAGVARNTAIFSIATGASRIAGLAREVVAASYFGTSGAASAFTIAFQVPNLVRGLFADAALSAAFVPVFAEYLEKGKRREAVLLASTLFWIILLVLGAITAFFILAAGVIMPLFIPGTQFTPQLVDLTVGLSQILFPVVVLLGHQRPARRHRQRLPPLHDPGDRPARLEHRDHRRARRAARRCSRATTRSTPTRSASCSGTIVQLAMVIPVLGRIDFRLKFHLNWRDPGVKRVFILMLPVTIGLGVINVDLLINSVDRRADLRERAARDRRGVPHLHAAAGHVQRRARDGALPVAEPARRARATRRACAACSARACARTCCCSCPAAAVTMVLAAPDRASSSTSTARSGLGLDGRGLAGAVLVLVLAAVRRGQPALHAHVLLAPAPVDPDGARRAEPRRQPRAVARALRPARDRRARDRDRGRQRGVMAFAQARSLARDCSAGRSRGAETAIATAKILAASDAARARRRTASGRGSTRSSATRAPLTRVLAVGPAIAAGCVAYWAAVRGAAGPGGAADQRLRHWAAPRAR